MKREAKMGIRRGGDKPATLAPYLKDMLPQARRITRERKVNRKKEFLNGNWDQPVLKNVTFLVKERQPD